MSEPATASLPSRSRASSSGGDGVAAESRKRSRSVGPSRGAGDGASDDSWEAQLAAVRQRLGKPVLTLQERLRILHVDLQLRKANSEINGAVRARRVQDEQETKRAKRDDIPDDARIVPGNFRSEVTRLTGFAAATVHSVVGPYHRALKDGKTVGEALDTVGVAPPRGNFTTKNKRVPVTKAMARLVRTFVREKRAKEEQVNATHITMFLHDKGLLPGIKKNADGSMVPKSLESARRLVRNLLVRLGYRRGRRTDGQVEEKPHHIEVWTTYLTTMKENRALPVETRRCEVYLDESYCHNYHHNSKLSVYDPNDKADKQKKEKHKGRRYCFAAAIRGPDPAVRTSKAA